MIIVNCCYVHNLHHLFLAKKKKKKKKLTPFAIIFLVLCICATVIDEPLISHESTTHSHISWFQRLSLQIISKLLEL